MVNFRVQVRVVTEKLRPIRHRSRLTEEAVTVERRIVDEIRRDVVPRAGFESAIWPTTSVVNPVFSFTLHSRVLSQAELPRHDDNGVQCWLR